MAAVWTPLMAIYNYDPSILDNLHVPTADELPTGIDYIDPLPELSDEDLRLELLMELGELCPVYSDPEILKQMIAIWDRINHKNWLQLWQTTLYKYNPIWNKDGSYTETRELTAAKTESEDTSANGSETYSGETSETVSGTESGTASHTESGTHSETTTHTVTGFDTNSLSPAYADATSGSDSGQSNDTTSSTTGSTSSGESGSTTTTTATGSRDGEENRTERETITRKEQGNIGVTTTQAMIREQREIVEFNIYNFIIESFKKRFMIQVYDI